ncbi:glycolate oxidase iron-sulfur subunit [Desulfonispora thiosulfatigenes DSM 11270]|uniref:Glycolate oxidase iron-sulfur subunit n=1 Tax=Desulfonispora thiosulfatigenes DSM 11270 TaxID=656914 RepID=A0A1W1UK18_DESTI|nr:(Fe-S)-binding protein [Desulfonispora thiosulfatigenes]SMB81475.1 glycolate oxidase iron-sulfur subunit [Desulfonispora thiosulfatigenes DSM 11270]
MNKDELLEMVMKCNRCGFCQEVCPTYKTSGNEFQLARGRNKLIRMTLEGVLNLKEEPELEKYINECLLCGACVEKCPAGVNTTELIAQMRNETTKIKGLSLAKRVLLKNVFSDNKKTDRVIKLMRFYQTSGTQSVLTLSDRFKNLDSKLPDIPKENVRSRLKKLLYRSLDPKEKVGYFLGCSVNNFFPNVAISTIKVLQENGYEVLVPETKCCGAPHFSAGNQDEYIKLAQENVEILSCLDTEVIIIDCQTCGSMLRDYKELFKDDETYKIMANKIYDKIIDISTFLLKYGYKKEMGKVTRRVTYHDPCHGVRYLKVKNAPRKILENIPGIEFVEMDEADTCCGGAGSYGIFNPVISKNIINRKIDNFQKTGASIIATSCPACTMQLQSGLKLNEIPGEVKHPIELLALAYDNR